MNSIGSLYRLTTFGESHGEAVGGIIDGMPEGITVDLEFLQKEMQRRRPGQSKVTTGRQEPDEVKLLSGIFNEKTTGCPIGFAVFNTNQRSQDYSNIANVFRPSHADYTYDTKYDGNRDYRGGGRSSARETLSRVVGGAFAKMALKSKGITIQAYTSQIGSISLENDYTKYDLNTTENNIVRCPDQKKAQEMEELVGAVKAEGDTIGGVVTCVIKGLPVGLGEPAFGKLHAKLAEAMMSINAAKGFEYGQGFGGVSQRGSEQNDEFCIAESKEITTKSNKSGGIQGGISNGQDIYFRVAFKPVATLLREQNTVNKAGEEIKFTTNGRHDPCVVPRAVPIVEAMAAMVILDNYLMQGARINFRE